MGHNSAEYLHSLSESFKLSFADTTWFCADMSQIEVPVSELLSKDYAAKRRLLIKPDRWVLCNYCRFLIKCKEYPSREAHRVDFKISLFFWQMQTKWNYDKNAMFMSLYSRNLLQNSWIAELSIRVKKGIYSICMTLKWFCFWQDARRNLQGK